ncbi:hypothetical protein I3271_00075 [Photobacterium leiognathi]|uniref:hypothetical protein n=1 Tax=Photobacterium leiognathi TaxID=553611 RepID=UPI001EDDBC61|nr:hypothetical protein [Photobacterium leiognathi]MCG3883087.1 hypothetical protein [Photobacterium leiognathi]
MSRPFNVQILKNGTELKAKVLYFIDRPDCSGQDMMAIVSGSLEVISHESIIGGEAIKSELDKFDELTDTITGEEANRLYNSGRRITAFTLSSLNTNNEKQLVSIEINPNGKSLNDNLTEISLKHDAFGFKFTK